MVDKRKSNRQMGTNISVQAYDAIVVELFPTVDYWAEIGNKA